MCFKTRHIAKHEEEHYVRIKETIYQRYSVPEYKEKIKNTTQERSRQIHNFYNCYWTL